MDTLSVRGSSVILNCSAYSEPSPKIEWKKDGTFLNLVSDDRRQLLSDGSLFISNVVHSKHNKPDEGYYQCVATVESLGTIVSRTAKLTVAGTFLKNNLFVFLNFYERYIFMKSSIILEFSFNW